MRTQATKDAITHRLMSEYLFDISPELYQTCIEAVKPMLEDERYVPIIYNYVFQNQNCVFNTDNAHFYLAVIYRIYSPLHLYSSNTRLQIGLRKIIATSFGYVNGEMVNYFANVVLPHYKNPRWASQVNKLAFEIVENIKSERAYIATIANDKGLAKRSIIERMKKRRFKRLSNYHALTVQLAS